MTKASDNNDLKWRIKILEQGLSQLGQGIVLISKRGEVVLTSEAAQEMIYSNDGLRIDRKALVANFLPDNQRLQHSIQSLIRDDMPADDSHALYIHRGLNMQPYQLRMSRLSESGKDEDERRSGHSVIVMMKDLHANYTHWFDRLKEQFNLTNREAECAVLLSESRDVQEISEIMRLSEDTARQYLKNAYKKMDVQKQHELVCLALEYRRKR